MTTIETRASGQPDADATAVQYAGGIVQGMRVLTMAGALPVEYLHPGERIITRSGMRVLRSVSVRVEAGAAVVHIAPGALGHGRPDADLVLPAGQTVRLRDWRAQALFGRPEADIPLARIADGEFIRLDRAAELRLFTLIFDAEEVVYADGLDLPCPGAPCLCAQVAA